MPRASTINGYPTNSVRSRSLSRRTLRRCCVACGIRLWSRRLGARPSWWPLVPRLGPWDLRSRPATTLRALVACGLAFYMARMTTGVPLVLLSVSSPEWPGAVADVVGIRGGVAAGSSTLLIQALERQLSLAGGRHGDYRGYRDGAPALAHLKL